MIAAREVQGRRFNILGGARSGLAVARLLVSHGAKVFLSDQAPPEKMRRAAEELDMLGIAYEFGGHSNKVLEGDALVVSPGIPSNIALVQAAKSMDLPIFSELEIASWYCPGAIVAITGTNGKTTTTTLTGRMFDDARRPTVVAGNIGTAFSQVVGDMTSESIAVLEVSSFQLDFINSFRPKVAAILNITPDHLDRYDHRFENYVAAKVRIFQNQAEGDTLIFNADDRIAREMVEKHLHPNVTRLPFSTRQLLEQGAMVRSGVLTMRVDNQELEVVPVASLSLFGEHNVSNALAALLAAWVLDVPIASIRATLKNFKGVEHRLEFIRELDGITYINDSKATNVDAVWYALRSFKQPVVALMGGRDKGNDYRRLHDPVRTHVRAIVAIGESANKVVEAFSGIVPVVKASTMEGAVSSARKLAVSGDVVLLSPACASFDWFENFEHRGRVFRETVIALNPAS